MRVAIIRETTRGFHEGLDQGCVEVAKACFCFFRIPNAELLKLSRKLGNRLSCSLLPHSPHCTTLSALLSVGIECCS